MKIATWNVNGIRARAAQLSAWVDAERPDIVCLQELKATAAQVPPEVGALAGYRCSWHGERAYSGVALLVREETFPCPPPTTHPAFDHDCRVIAIELPVATMMAVYVPNGGKDLQEKLRFLEAMVEHAAEMRTAGRPLVVCGDLNVAHREMDVHPKERKPNAVGQLAEERALFDQLLAQGLVDVARALHPDDDNLFTWWAPWRNLRQRNIGWRIDYILASTDLASRARSFISQREVGTSDHAPVIAEFD